MMRIPRPVRPSPGQALVEFALVFPILMLMILGVVETGRAIFAYNTVSEAARTAVRVAIVNQDVTSIQNAVLDDPRIAWLGLTAANVAPPTYSCGATLSIGCIVTTTVTYDFRPVTPIVSSVFGPVTLSSSSALPIEKVSP